MCGYLAGGFCAVYLGTLESGCVSPKWVVSSIWLGLAFVSEKDYFYKQLQGDLGRSD